MEQKLTKHESAPASAGATRVLPQSCGAELQDMIERANLQEAKHRNHRRERCTLPSDHLSDEELTKLNGPVRSWNLRGPMTPGVFRSMPEDLQDRYLMDLQARIFGKEQCDVPASKKL